MERRSFLKAAAASAGLAVAPSIALSAIPDGPAPWRDLVRHCIEIPKVAGYFDRAYFHSPYGTRQIWAQTLAVGGWSAEEVCAALRDEVDRQARAASRVYWRKLPTLRQILGSNDEDTRGDRDGIDRVVIFKRPYWIASLRIGTDPPPEDGTTPLLFKEEGLPVAWIGEAIEAHDRKAGVAITWPYKNWNTGEVLGPKPPPLSRSWHSPRPVGVTVLS